MRTLWTGLAMTAFVCAGAAALQAQAPAGAPSGATGQCKDGTYSTAASKGGACRGHQGVQTWFSESAAAAKTKAATPAPAGPVAPSVPKSSAAAKPALSTPAVASGPAPAGSTGQCKDGTYSSAASKSGACRGHGGVGTWFAAAGSPAGPSSGKPAPPAAPASNQATPMPAPRPAPAAVPAPRPMPTTAPAPPPASAAPSRAAVPPARTTAAPGGGNGQVWVNTDTKVYHCSGDRYYGKTKQGTYMSESDAQAKGYRADAGKPCTK